LKTYFTSRVATCLRCGGSLIITSVANLSLSLTVKEFWKSVKIWPSYHHEFGGPFFGTQCRAKDVLPTYTARKAAERVFVPSNLERWPLLLTFKLVRARDQTHPPCDSIWSKSVQRFQRYLTHKQKHEQKWKKVTDSAKTEPCLHAVKTKARLSRLLRHPVWKRRGTILVSTFQKSVSYLLTCKVLR